MVNVAFDPDWNLPTHREMFLLRLSERKVGPNNVRSSWGEGAISSEVTSRFYALQFKNNAAIWDGNREAGRIDEFALNPKQVPSRPIRPIFSSPVYVINPLLHLTLLQVNRAGLQFGLSLDSTKRSERRAYAANTNKNKNSRSKGCDSIPDERPFIDVAMILLLRFGFGVLFIGFLPLKCCLPMPKSVNYDRILFCASCFGSICASCSVTSHFLWGLYPYTWGLPAQWLRKKWDDPRRHSEYRQSLPHAVNVTQYHSRPRRSSKLTMLTLPATSRR